MTTNTPTTQSPTPEDRHAVIAPQLDALAHRIVSEINVNAHIARGKKSPRVKVRFVRSRIGTNGSYYLDFTVKKENYIAVIRSYMGHTIEGFTIINSEPCGGWKEALLEVVALHPDVAHTVAATIRRELVSVAE